MTLVLPEPLQRYVESRVAHGEFGTPNEYIRDLIRRDREQRLSALEDELVLALAGERTTVSTDDLTGGNLGSILKASLNRKE